MADLIQSATWPGVIAVESCNYVCLHGITPGRAVMSTFPQGAPAPQEFGSLAFSDGIHSVAIRGCKVDTIGSSMTSEGTSYVLEIVDRRWRWQFGSISGVYNQKDDNGKLIPWTIRSPSELAALCLAEMGEVNALVILPPGLSRAGGANLDRYLRLGENYPQTLTNPEVVWDHTVPAQALARLVETWGCRIIYQPILDRVLIAPLGVGKPFPNVAAEMISANVSGPAAPAYVAAFSSDPVKIQCRLLLQAVGKEWDGSYVPINQLSYSPINPDQVQITSVDGFRDGAADSLYVIVTFRGIDGTQKTASAITSPGGTNGDKFTSVVTTLTGNPDFLPVLVATANTTGPDVTGFTVKGRAPGAFSIQTLRISGVAPSYWCKPTLVQVGASKDNTWARCPPPSFPGIQATNRLSPVQAKGLAEESVLRCYRIMARDPHDMNSPLDKPGRTLLLPWFGPIARRQQIVLQSSKVNQVIPMPRIPGAINKFNVAGGLNANVIPGGGVLPEFYNGYSRAQAPTVTGSVWKRLGGTGVFYWNGVGENTDAGDRVYVDFSINAKEQMIVFSSPVWAWAPGGGAGATYLREPVLTLETGVYVQNSETNQFQKWEEALRILNGTGPWEWFPREDIRVGVIGTYDDQNRLLGFTFDGVQDAVQRAGYYLRGQGAKYQIKGGEVRQIIGILPFDPDGYCQQVEYKVGAGATTILSGNTESHPSIAQYDARRRPENLPADQSAAIANFAERLGWKDNKADAPK